MVQSKKPAPAEVKKPEYKSGLIQSVADAFKKYQEMCGIIHKDYLLDDGAVVELGCADENFLNELADLDGMTDEMGEPEEISFEQVKEGLKNADVDADQINEMLEILNEIDEDVVQEWAAEKRDPGIYLDISSMADREKLRGFLETEIWPDYNQQKEKINF